LCSFCSWLHFRRSRWRSFGMKRKLCMFRYLGLLLWRSSGGCWGWGRLRWGRSSSRDSCGMLGLCMFGCDRSAARGNRRLFRRGGRCFVCRSRPCLRRCSVRLQSTSRRLTWLGRKSSRCFGLCSRCSGCTRWGYSVVWLGRKIHRLHSPLVRK
jgi:hypothetical protein